MFVRFGKNSFTGGSFMKLKKLLAVTLGILMINSAISMPVQAAEISLNASGAQSVQKSGETSGDYEYEVNDDGTTGELVC